MSMYADGNGNNPDDEWASEPVSLPPVASPEWITFTRRTDELKLIWLEQRLSDWQIPHRRNGASFHAPILQVPLDQIEEAWKILTPIDDWDDGDDRFALDALGEAFPWDIEPDDDELNEQEASR